MGCFWSGEVIVGKLMMISENIPLCRKIIHKNTIIQINI
jgi:hypothetical protein